jgi:hypothetical protein
MEYLFYNLYYNVVSSVRDAHGILPLSILSVMRRPPLNKAYMFCAYLWHPEVLAAAHFREGSEVSQCQ